MWVSTFHALCARLLRREAPHIGLSRDFVIYDSTDQLTVVKQALKTLGIDDGVTQPRAALSRISHAKNRMEGPGVFSDASWNPREQQIAKLYELYTKALKDANALDFDDLLLKTVELFETVRAGARTIRQEIPVSHGRRVPGHEPPAVPADPAPGRHPSQPVRRRRPRPVDLQVAWRGPSEHPRLRARFSRGRRSSSWSETTARRKSSSMRRLRSFLRTATARRSGSTPTSPAAHGSVSTAAATTWTRRSSSRRTARAALHDDHESSVAILYRTNAQSRTIEDALRRVGTAYKIIGGVRFYERKEVKDALAYLKLILSPQDDVSLRRVINVPARGIGKGVMESLEAIEVPDGDRLRHAAARRTQTDAGVRARRCGRDSFTPSTGGCSHRGPSPHSRHSAT